MSKHFNYFMTKFYYTFITLITKSIVLTQDHKLWSNGWLVGCWKCAVTSVHLLGCSLIPSQMTMKNFNFNLKTWMHLLPNNVPNNVLCWH